MFHADGQTGMTNVIAAFRNFANAPKSACLVKKWLKASMEVDLFLEESAHCISCVFGCKSRL